jgi:hypothetical protein
MRMSPGFAGAFGCPGYVAHSGRRTIHNGDDPATEIDGRDVLSQIVLIIPRHHRTIPAKSTSRVREPLAVLRLQETIPSQKATHTMWVLRSFRREYHVDSVTGRMRPGNARFRASKPPRRQDEPVSRMVHRFLEKNRQFSKISPFRTRTRKVFVSVTLFTAIVYNIVEA